MLKCEICGNEHSENKVHRFVGEDGIELITKKQAKELIAGQHNPNWGFVPALK